METNNYIIEKNLIFSNFLEKHFFNKFREGNEHIEFFLKSQCPGKCAYCYLKKHGKDLYPYEYQDDELILNNLKLLLDWYKENKFKNTIELFSGEIITSGFFFKVLDVIYEAFSEEFLSYKPKNIIIPENGDFLEDLELIKKVESYIEKFLDIDIELIFSISIDGKYMDLNRNSRDDEYYKRAIDFCNKYIYAFHPMISAFNIEKWIDNYDWWNNEEIPNIISDHLMTLEVRDNNWTEEKINEYLKFLNHVIDKEFEKCFSDPELFAKRLTGADNYPEKGYFIIGYAQGSSEEKDYRNHGLTCSLTNTLHIRVGDLKIVPCHRLGYEQFVTGQLEVKDNKISGYIGENVELLVSILSWTLNNGPKCNKCDIRHWCLGPCMGSNFENTNNLFTPPESVCNLFKSKIIFLIMKYQDLGLFPYFKKLLPKDRYNTLINYVNKINGSFENYGQYYKYKIDDCKKQRKPVTELQL